MDPTTKYHNKISLHSLKLTFSDRRKHWVLRKDLTFSFLGGGFFEVPTINTNFRSVISLGWSQRWTCMEHQRFEDVKLRHFCWRILQSPWASTTIKIMVDPISMIKTLR